MRILVPLLVVGIVIAIVVIARRSRRRADATPDLHQHPERLEQNLDSSDDA